MLQNVGSATHSRPSDCVVNSISMHSAAVISSSMDDVTTKLALPILFSIYNVVSFLAAFTLWAPFIFPLSIFL